MVHWERGRGLLLGQAGARESEGQLERERGAAISERCYVRVLRLRCDRRE
jgi:hypothetical protein